MLRRMALGLALLSVACARREQRLQTSERGPRAAGDSSAAPAPSSLASAYAERRGEREHLVRETIAARGVSEARVLSAMRRVPRHRFVPKVVADAAYADRPLPIGWGQTISQPYIVAAMTEAVAPKPEDRCLEIGTGSGYQAAVLAELCAKTYSIEYVPELAAFGKKNLRSLGYAVELRTGDGYRGWPEAAPFDVIVVTAAPERVPDPLLEQLAVGGRLVIPVGPQDGAQELILYTRTRPGKGDQHFERRQLAAVRFVPFLGDAGGP
jgi:protein-L-isoaspartate(D-aspartate) O-methyltransferase